MWSRDKFLLIEAIIIFLISCSHLPTVIVRKVPVCCWSSSHLPTPPSSSLQRRLLCLLIRVCVCMCVLRGANTSFRLGLSSPPSIKRERAPIAVFCVSSSASSSSFLYPTHLSMKDTVLPQGIVCLAAEPATAIWVQGRHGDPPPWTAAKPASLHLL